MSEQETIQTEEDKFFGVRTKIGGQPEPEPVEEEEPLEEVAEADTDEGELTDDELSGYSKRVQKRINKLKYESHEERRKTQSAMQERDEAFRVAQQIAEKNKEYESLIGRGEQALINQVKERAALAVDQAKQQYRKAYEEGDADAMAKAQELLSKATLAEQQANSTAQRVQNHIVENMPAEPPQVPQRQLDPDMEQWAKRNTWFMGGEPFQQKMTSYAMYLDQKSEHDPASNPKDYYAEIDKEMKREFPDFFGVSSDSNSEMVVEETPKRQPQQVVATATRDSGNKKPTQIRLTKTQVSLARQLGISPEQYANQLLKES